MLRENGATLQNRISDLQNDIRDESERTKRAESLVITLQDKVKGLRAFYNDYESDLVPKTRETRDLEAEENRVFDLHREAMDALRVEHSTHVAVIEAEFGEELAESKREY